MDTKLKGDIAEQAVILKCLNLELEVLKPIGDRLPFDLVVSYNNKFIKIQIKSAWYNKKLDQYFVDTRRSKTNRKNYKKERYKEGDFDFVIVFIKEHNLFYIIPAQIFLSYKSAINFILQSKRLRNNKIFQYQENWNLLLTF